MSYRKQPATLGGIQLRRLRESYGKTQLDVELDANLGIGYLQRLELGKVQQPERETLERIVGGLGATFAERRTILAEFGYRVPITLPDEVETAWAIERFLVEVAHENVPVYLLDWSHRLLVWNALVPKLFATVGHTSGIDMMPKLLFDPYFGIQQSIVNSEDFFSNQIHILHFELQRCGDASWFAAFIEEMRQYDLFDKYWAKQAKRTCMQPMTRPLARLVLDIASRLLHFRLLAHNFVHDPRFRVIYCIPADPTTFAQCEEMYTGEASKNLSSRAT